MQKKGFTLVETLVVIALLAAISVTIGLSFSGMIQKQAENDEKKFDETIEDAACLYAEKNKIDFDTSVKIKTLIDQGLLRKDLTSPSSKDKITSIKDYCVTINWKDNERTCTYTKEGCEEYVLPYVSKLNVKIENRDVTLNLVAEDGTNKIKKYYFSIDNGINFVESDTDTYTFHNLTEGITYTVKGKVSDTENRFSNVVSGSANIKKYELPTITSVTTDSTSSTIKVNINAKGGDGKVTEYYYSIDNGKTYIKRTNASYTFTGLSLQTTYNIKVYVKDNNGKSSAIATTTEKTKGYSFADHIKSKYTGVQGENNMYYHNASLENGAYDFSYRYAGTTDTTNNFVCFGYVSTDGSCPTDNLYRIIGVFSGRVKLIKFDFANANLLGTNGTFSYTSIKVKRIQYYTGDLTNINTYSWHGSNYGEWETSELNKTNLNYNYLNNIGYKWSNKIAEAKWYVGGYSGEDLTVTGVYKGEVGDPNNTVFTGKVGLMYVSDYGYSAMPHAWTLYIGTHASGYKRTSWIFTDYSDWTITPKKIIKDSALYITGGIGGPTINAASVDRNYSMPVRPAFYLKDTVSYVSGEGTRDKPYIID